MLDYWLLGLCTSFGIVNNTAHGTGSRSSLIDTVEDSLLVRRKMDAPNVGYSA
jgi:hypothetical protein